MMIAESSLATTLPRARRNPARASAPESPRGFVFAVAALPGEAEGFRWPSWLSPVARSWNPDVSRHNSSKRNR